MPIYLLKKEGFFETSFDSQHGALYPTIKITSKELLAGQYKLPPELWCEYFEEIHQTQPFKNNMFFPDLLRNSKINSILPEMIERIINLTSVPKEKIKTLILEKSFSFST